MKVLNAQFWLQHLGILIRTLPRRSLETCCLYSIFICQQVYCSFSNTVYADKIKTAGCLIIFVILCSESFRYKFYVKL